MKSRVNLTNVFGTKSITLDQYPPEAWDWVSGDPDAADKADVRLLSETVPWLYRGVSILVQAVATVPVCMVKGKKDVGYLGGELDSPFPYDDDLSALLRHITASVVLEGCGYLFRDNASTIQATKKLWYWNPLTVTFDAKTTEKTKTISFKRQLGSKTDTYTSKEVIYFWPEDVYVEIGPPRSSPAKAALCAAGVLYNVDQYVAAYFKRGAVKAMMLSVKGNPPEDEKNRFLKWWRETTGGVKKAFNAFMINAESVTPTLIGDGITGLQDSSLTQEKREDISTALGIPQSILFSTGAGGLGGGGVMTEDTYRLYQMTAVPLAKFLIDVLNKQQFQDTGYQLQVREEEMDIFQEDEQARAAALTQTVTALASPETFLIAAAIQGYDLSEEVQTQIQALITKKEADRQQIQAQLNQAPTQPTDQQPPAQDAPNKAMMDDLARLRRKALKNIGKDFCFESPNIPNLAELLAQLKACTTENEIKAIFDTDITPPPEYGNPDYSALLEAMRLEIVGIKSNNQPGNIIIDTTGRSVESTILSNQNIGLDITKSIHSMSERMEKSIEAMTPIINIPAPVVNVTVEPTPIKVTNDVKIPKQEPPKVEVKATPVIHNKPTKSHEKQKIVRDAKGVMIGTESETTFEYKE